MERVTTQWLPKPIEVENALADSADQMKPYAEVIPGSEVAFEMVPIPGGTFTMGSPESEADRGEDEGPQHKVQIDPFWMGKYEVTWDEFELYGFAIDFFRWRKRLKEDGQKPTRHQLLADAISKPSPPYADPAFGMETKGGYPATAMSQLTARCYCKWLSAKTGRYYRLPTEAEWEYACRAGTTTAYSFGDDPGDLDEYGWHFDSADDTYQKVGQKKPNPWGLHDMHGNVMEWVLDRYQADYYDQFAGKTTSSPYLVPTDRYPRVARGGCWDDDPDQLRSAARQKSTERWNQEDPRLPPGIWFLTAYYSPGFRVVRPLKVPTPCEAKKFEPDYETIIEWFSPRKYKSN